MDTGRRVTLMTSTPQQNSKAQHIHLSAGPAGGTTPVSVTLDPQAQLESDKRAVYRRVVFDVKTGGKSVKGRAGLGHRPSAPRRENMPLMRAASLRQPAGAE
ncbi:hypothetical protein DNTS_033699 [Danionella cerebrum]|uniref:Uncharacterized protein n=1 Tax=Danionella cerebrum TaxID=2873325 RepID=A0A553QWD3_9TELE|nr:hypothetical protein DNTS_033699 [Danionella translucida]